MKNIYIIFLIFFGITACDPLDETYEELDATVQDPTSVQDVTLTLTEDEYDLLEEYDVASFGNFNSEDEAKEYIPKILDQVYPHLGNGSSALVTYDLYSPIGINEEVSYTLAPEDYVALDESGGSLGSEGDIISAVEYITPNASEHDVVAITYEYDSETGVETRTSKVAYINSSWYIAYEPTSEDYRFMGQSFDNFSSRSLAKERIAVLFDRLYPFAEEGDLRASVFTYTSEDDNDTPDVPEDDVRFFEDFLAVFSFNGENWEPIQDVMPKTFQFGNEDGVWIPDNTIRYTLSAADHTAIGNTWEDGAAKTSLLQYGNFDLSLWNTDEIAAAIGNHLQDLFPDAEEGQKYLVTYLTYSGGAGSDEVLLILNAEGEYEIVE